MMTWFTPTVYQSIYIQYLLGQCVKPSEKQIYRVNCDGFPRYWMGKRKVGKEVCWGEGEGGLEWGIEGAEAFLINMVNQNFE